MNKLAYELGKRAAEKRAFGWLGKSLLGAGAGAGIGALAAKPGERLSGALTGAGMGALGGGLYHAAPKALGKLQQWARPTASTAKTTAQTAAQTAEKGLSRRALALQKQQAAALGTSGQGVMTGPDPNTLARRASALKKQQTAALGTSGQGVMTGSNPNAAFPATSPSSIIVSPGGHTPSPRLQGTFAERMQNIEKEVLEHKALSNAFSGSPGFYLQ